MNNEDKNNTIFLYFYEDKLVSPYHGSFSLANVGRVERGTLRFRIDIITHHNTPVSMTRSLIKSQ